MCKKCGIEKELTEESFYLQPNNGLFRTECRVCRAKQQHEYHESRYEKKRPTTEELANEHARTCKVCGQEKELNENNFYKFSRNRASYFLWTCNICRLLYGKERSAICRKQEGFNERRQEKRRPYEKEKRRTNPDFRITESFRSMIKDAIRLFGGSKYRKSCFEGVGYDGKALISHLVSQMIGENSWMTLANHGKYNAKTWNDNDPSTWTWNVDHIIPRSDLPYFSMDDENFKKCWALENLRPYSAKLNILDGANRTRHAKKKDKDEK